MGHQCRLKPYQNFHESQKFGPRKIFKLAQCLPPRCLASPDTWPPTDRARDGRGRFGGLQVQRVSPRLSTSAPPAPRRLAVPASFAFSRLDDDNDGLPDDEDYDDDGDG